MFPVLGREVVKGEQHLAIFGQAGNRLVVLRAVLAREAIEGGLGLGAAFRLIGEYQNPWGIG